MRGICLSRDLWQKLRKKNRPKQAQNQALQVFFTCIPPPFFAYRRFRWVFSLTILLTTWGVTWVQSFYYQIESITAQQIFTQFLFVMGTIPYAIFIVLPISQFSIFFRRLLWYLLAVLGPCVPCSAYMPSPKTFASFCFPLPSPSFYIPPFLSFNGCGWADRFLTKSSATSVRPS